MSLHHRRLIGLGVKQEDRERLRESERDRGIMRERKIFYSCPSFSAFCCSICYSYSSVSYNSSAYIFSSSSSSFLLILISLLLLFSFLLVIISSSSSSSSFLLVIISLLVVLLVVLLLF